MSRDELPLAESAGALVSALGLDYLIDGQADLAGSLLLAAAVAGTCVGIRLWHKRRRR